MPVVNLYRIEPEWPDDYVYIGRAGHGFDGYFGNPFRLEKEENREKILWLFDTWARAKIVFDPEYKERVKELYGKTLVCFCTPKPCHGDVLLQIAEELNADGG